MVHVIGAGLGRTGTSSLKVALERLGFTPCYHMFEVLGSAGRMRQWTAVARGGGPDWEDIFRGYRACVDFPAAAYWRELAAHYPEAKVILTLRDPDAWFESARKTIFRLPRLMRHPVLGPLLRLLLPRRSRPAMFIRMLGALNRDRRDIAFDRDSALAYFERHNAEVMASVPAERLLVYRVGEGWEPLCAFLGVPVPDEPFPRANDSESFWSNFHRTLRGRDTGLVRNAPETAEGKSRGRARA
ncbi:sulfotransferase family protein [Planobispora longispora]|uniref:Sulfotransferase family protein n=1 Tax=Planobispora longispora TaxID=28887 RepID=A0A8J3RUQ6_9ACTN|nr:sulfotransferase family protein [Planobispora longispora]GIH81584.1 sulfotransferase family protein [Planobispora longispora]